VTLQKKRRNGQVRWRRVRTFDELTLRQELQL